MIKVFLRLITAVLLLTGTLGHAGELALKSGSPVIYTVKEGDTLWNIASRFLVEPWRWPEILLRNPQIEDPEQLYAGDVLILGSHSDGVKLKVLRVEKLTPQVRVVSDRKPVPSIAPDVIQPFLVYPQMLEQQQLTGAGRVIIGVEGDIVLGQFHRFYAKHLPNSDNGRYRIIRPGNSFSDPETGEDLGTPAKHLGTARLISSGAIGTLEVIESKEEIQPGDLLLPVAEEVSLPYFFPRTPDNEVSGYIVGINDGLSEVGVLSVVIVSLGYAEGIKRGDVVQVSRRGAVAKDPATGKIISLPEEPSAYLMVFKVFEKVSYGLIIQADRIVHLYDRVSSPSA
tara:strand:+ start:484 stop:1506 length:1023 start_codon:yes stop_codon:yes gene_type:complete